MKDRLKIAALMIVASLLLPNYVVFSQPLSSPTRETAVQLAPLPDSSLTRNGNNAGENDTSPLHSTRQILATKQLLHMPLLSDFGYGLRSYRTPFSQLFKYDTSPNNPEHKCYEIKKTLSNQYDFSFKFLSFDRYTLGYRR